MTNVRHIVIEALSECTDALDDTARRARLEEGGDLDLSDLDLDSLTRYEIMMKIEDALDIELDDDDMQRQTTVNALTAYLETQIAA